MRINCNHNAGGLLTESSRVRDAVNQLIIALHLLCLIALSCSTPTAKNQPSLGYQNEDVAGFENVEATLPDSNRDYVEIASHPVEEEPAVLECEGGPKKLLWRVESDTSTVYLFGSIHFGRPDFYPLAASVEAAFEASEVVVVEVDMRSVEADAFSDANLPVGQTIRDAISAELYDHLIEVMSTLGLTIEPFQAMRPWMLATTLSVLKIQSLGYSSADGVELYLLGKAGDREILELESISEQVGLLQSLDGELFLSETLLSLDEAASYFDRLFDAWRCGRDEDLEMIIIEQYGDDLEGHEEMMEDVIFERNVMMANRVEELLKRPGTYFLVVGAGHMVGDRGIPAELRKRHYDVVRL